MKLSILIPTIYSRWEYFALIATQLDRQIAAQNLAGVVEILDLCDDGEDCIGNKRNELIRQAQGDYIVFVDDDDEVSPDYCTQVLSAIEKAPDVVTFNMERFIDGKRVGTQVMRLAQKERIIRDGADGLLDYQYPPSHLCPIRREIALSVQFLPINRGEDVRWSDEINPLLRTEEYIPLPLYRYMYRNSRPGEVTNEQKRGKASELDRQIDAEMMWAMAFAREDDIVFEM